MTDQQKTALSTMLLCLADDEYIIGHRMSEWTGQGPIIEEDIAFSSMAQDELGHALGFYTLLHELGAADPDTLVFTRDASAYRNSIFTEQPRGDYAYSMMRQFLYDGAETERLGALASSAFEPLRDLASRMLQEERYHWLHNATFVRRLAQGTEESRLRMQSALTEAFPFALGLFEPYDGEEILVAEGIAPAEDDLRRRWLARMCPLLEEYGLRVPAHKDGEVWQPEVDAVLGGRRGRHTEHLLGILDAMHVLRDADPDAVNW
jgi:ring-1,2-phenylacetyl-CoA epoxidase subunit PaaC